MKTEQRFKEMVSNLIKSGETIKEQFAPSELEITNSVIKLQMETVAIVENYTVSPKISSQMEADWFSNFHAAIGMTSEAGELIDAMKKLFIYRAVDDPKKKQKAIQNVIEELGDMEFYMEAFTDWDLFEDENNNMQKILSDVRDFFGFSYEMILQQNIYKLTDKEKGRYASGTYSDDAAHQRQDKEPTRES